MSVGSVLSCSAFSRARLLARSLACSSARRGPDNLSTPVAGVVLVPDVGWWRGHDRDRRGEDRMIKVALAGC